MSNFNIKQHNWFIRIESRQHCAAVQEWLFEQGVKWQYNTDGKPDHLNSNFLTNTYSDGTLGKHLYHASMRSAISPKCKEIVIKTTTKVVIDEVVYPVIETEQQKQIRELKETIEKAQKQIDALEKAA